MGGGKKEAEEQGNERGKKWVYEGRREEGSLGKLNES